MVSLSPCPQAQQPGVSPPRLSGTFTHLQSSHKVKDYNSVLNQFDLEVADGRFVWSCGPRPPTINLLKMMLSLNHQQQPEKNFTCSTKSWIAKNSVKIPTKWSKESSVNLLFCFQMTLDDNRICSSTGPGAINEDIPHCHCAKPMKPTILSPVVRQARPLSQNQDKSARQSSVSDFTCFPFLA